MTIYRVYYFKNTDYHTCEETTIGYYYEREIAEYVAKHFKNPDEFGFDAMVEEVEVQITYPIVYED